MKPGRLIFILAITLAGVVIYINKCGNNKTETAAIGVKQTGPPKPVNVSGYLVSFAPFEEKIYASGSILASEEVTLSNEIAGKITSITFKEGSRVSKGDLLVKLYDADLKAQLKKLTLQKELSQKKEQRQKDVLKINGISQQEYEISLNELRTIEADIEIIQSQISKTEIRAPFDGTIGLKNVSPGAFLSINTIIATIQQSDPVKVEFNIPERYRPMVNENTIITFTTAATSGTFSGKIVAFEPKVNLETRSVVVQASCSNKNNKLIPGSFAKIEIPLRKLDNAILVPSQAIIPEIRGEKIFVCRNGKANKIEVETGTRTDTTIQIISGLNPGDTVIISGIMQMRPDMPLNVKVINNSVAAQ